MIISQLKMIPTRREPEQIMVREKLVKIKATSLACFTGETSQFNK